ncbi:MAG: branched-chain amino acid ABC transporter permease [Actinomycetes bacterium]
MSLQALFDGLFTGSLYGLLALTLTITYQPTRIMNFAQGETFILGAAVGFEIVGVHKIAWPIALVLMLFFAVIMGLIMERMVMLPVQLSGSRFAWIIATLAAALIFQALFSLKYVGATLVFIPIVDKVFTIGGSVISLQQIIAILVSLTIIVAYDQFLRRSIYGRAMRATAHNPDTAIILGIPTKRIVVGAFVASSVLGALAGFLWAPEVLINPATGLFFTIGGFTAAVIGGVGSPRGALFGGLIVGLLNSVAGALFGGVASGIAVFLALGVILVLKPSGLFGKPMEGH